MITKAKLRELLTEEAIEIDRLINSGAIKVILTRAVEQTMQECSVYDKDEFITRKELARRWNVHVNTVSGFHNREKYKPTISYYRFGKSTSYKWSDCLDFARANFLTRD